jgi:gamma-glutamylcyclotransferase
MYYFAYGANLNKKQMASICPDAKQISPVTLPNYKLIFTGWARQWHGGIATIRVNTGMKVLGALYEISEGCLKKLDAYEGYPGNYGRIKVRVFNGDGKALEALAYIKTGIAEESQPSKEYLAIVQQGYRDWSLI